MVGRYRVSVNSLKAGYKNMCSGVVSVHVYSNFNFKPEGMIQCDMGMNIDAAMLAKDFDIPKEKLDPKAFAQAGYIVRKPNPVQGQPGPRFNPPRPSLIGPIVQNAETFKGFNYTEQSLVGGTTFAGQPIQDVGVFQVEVYEVGGTYTSSENPELVYNNVINWHMAATGFTGAHRSDTGVFDDQEFWFNTNPIAIPKIVMTNDFQSLVPPDQLDPFMANIGGLFLGKVQVVIEIMDMEQ